MKFYLIHKPYLYFILILFAPTICFSDELGDNNSASFLGFFQSSYKGRMLSDNLGADHKFTQFLDVELNNMAKKGFSIYFSGDFTVGDQTQSGDIFNTWDHSYHGAVYQLSSKISFFQETGSLEIGRQFVDNAFNIHIDGLSYIHKFVNNNAQLCMYAGMPVHYYDDVIFTDSTQAGASIKLYLKPYSTLNLAYQYLKEKPDCFENGSSEEIHQVAISFNQYIQKIGKFNFSGTTIDDRLDHINASLYMFFEQVGLTANMNCKYQFEIIDERPISESFLVDVSKPVMPYYYVDFNFSKSTHPYPIDFYAGLAIRKLENKDQEMDFNHSFVHEYVGLIVNDILSLDIILQLKAEIWQETGEGKNDFITGGYDITYTPDDQWCLKTGLDYSLYRYDYYMDLNEKDHIYTIYTEMLRKKWMNTDIKFRYNLDMYDLKEHRINITATYIF